MITVLILNILFGQGGSSVVRANNIDDAIDGYLTLYYEFCEESPEYDYSYAYVNIPGEAIPYFVIKEEPVDGYGTNTIYVKASGNIYITEVKADDVQYGKNYLLMYEFLTKYKGKQRIKVSLYRLSKSKIVKYRETKIIKGKTDKKLIKNLNKWLTKTIHDKSGVRFKNVKWKY